MNGEILICIFHIVTYAAPLLGMMWLLSDISDELTRIRKILESRNGK